MNNKMKILVIEDDRIQAEDIKEQLEEFGYEVIGPAYTSFEAMHLFKTNPPDLALIDIVLKGSPVDGIGLVKLFKKIKKIPVIFLSGNHNSTIRNKAKQVTPNYFLTKPVMPHQLDIAIDFALYNFMVEQGQKQVKNEIYKPGDIKTDFIFIKQHNNYVKINIKEINFIKALNNTTEIFLDYKTFLITTYLSDFLKKLDVDFIVKTHRSFAVNLNSVQSFNFANIHVVNNKQIEEIPLSETYRKNFLEKIKIIKTN